MFVKILDTTTREGSKLFSNVRDIYKSAEPRDKAYYEYDSCFIKENSENKDIWKLYITNNNGNSYYLLAEIGNVFIMNDDGKTIDRF